MRFPKVCDRTDDAVKTHIDPSLGLPIRTARDIRHALFALRFGYEQLRRQPQQVEETIRGSSFVCISVTFAAGAIMRRRQF